MTFTFCCLAWIFFRAQTVSDALYVLTHLLDGIGNPIQYLHSGLAQIGIAKLELIYLMFFIGLLTVYDYLSLKINVIEKIGKYSVLIRWSVYMLLILIIIFFAQIQAGGEFIYFQF